MSWKYFMDEEDEPIPTERVDLEKLIAIKKILTKRKLKQLKKNDFLTLFTPRKICLNNKEKK